MIISFNIEPSDLKKLDAMAGPQGRSRWLRKAIALHATYPSLISYAEMKRLHDELHPPSSRWQKACHIGMTELAKSKVMPHSAHPGHFPTEGRQR